MQHSAGTVSGRSVRESFCLGYGVTGPDVPFAPGCGRCWPCPPGPGCAPARPGMEHEAVVCIPGDPRPWAPRQARGGSSRAARGRGAGPHGDRLASPRAASTRVPVVFPVEGGEDADCSPGGGRPWARASAAPGAAQADWP